MKVKSFIFLVITLYLASCQTNHSKTNALLVDSNNPIVGRYDIRGFNSGISLALYKNGNFLQETDHWSCLGPGKVQQIKGQYRVQSNAVMLEPNKLIDIEYFDFKKRYRNRRVRNFSLVDSKSFRSSFKVYNWGDNIYLLSDEKGSPWGFKAHENDYHRFANYFNSDFEPDISGDYFVKRIDDNVPNGQFLSSQIPDQYVKTFLQEPLVANIMEITSIMVKGLDEESKISKQFKLDKGGDDGVFEGMILYGRDQCCNVKISIVKEEEESYGTLYQCYNQDISCQVSDQLTSSYKRARNF